MSLTALRNDLPRFVVPVVVSLLAVSLAYSVLVRASVVAWLALRDGILATGVVLVTVYLIYRLVLAVERIADDT